MEGGQGGEGCYNRDDVSVMLMCMVLELAVQLCAEADGVDQEGS